MFVAFFALVLLLSSSAAFSRGRIIRNTNPFRSRDHATHFTVPTRVSCFDQGTTFTAEAEEKLADLLLLQDSLERRAYPSREGTSSSSSSSSGEDVDVYVDDYMIPMRDGVRLMTTIEVPVANGTYGLVMKRTPYGTGVPGGYVPQYAAAVQDMRGCWASEGRFEFWRTCGEDGFDTLAWVEEQVWSNGNVFLTGSSADAIAALAVLTSAPPQLKAIYEIVGAMDGHKTSYYGGVYRTELMDNWLTAINPRTIDDVLANEAEGPWWDTLRGPDYYDNIIGPAVHYGGWYDIFQQGTTDAFLAGQYLSPPQGQGTHYLIVSPNGHCGNTYHPNTSISLPADLADEMFREVNEPGYESELLATTPAITFYLMGPDERLGMGNYWVQTPSWPEFNATNYYLTSTGTLSLTPSATGSRSFVFSPANPVPTLGGANLFAGCGPRDQAEADARSDVVTFTSSVLADPVYVVGNLTAVVYVSTSSPDSDFTVKLSDVYADGFVQIIADGIARLKWRLSDTTPSNPTPGVVYELTISLWRTAYVFAPGHQIRVSVSSSNDPRFRINPNNGLLIVDEATAPAQSPTNTIFLSSGYPSHIILPVVNPDDVVPSVAMEKFILQ